MDLKSYLQDFDAEEDRSGGIEPWYVTSLSELDGLSPADVPKEMMFTLEPVGAPEGLLEHAPAESRKVRGPFSYYVWEIVGEPESPEATRYYDALVAEVKRRERQVGDVEWAEAEVDARHNFSSIQYWIYMEKQTLRGAAEEAIQITSEIEKAARERAG